jgi:exopolyphosphatase/guanosine-5'-triphosphate,3'-diphosphate pyrophosphatase
VLKKTPSCVAAVDLGSNSFHMIVCSLNNGKLQTIDRLKEMVRLASGLDKKNYLDLETQNRALECLERFGQRIKGFPHDSVRIVGTNTLRTAKNAAQFLEKAEAALHHPIHIISGIEEARLIYQGVAHSLSGQANIRFVMDIGGGSTEYIIGTGSTPLDKESLPMGCVTISKLFFKHGKLSKSAFNDAVLFAQRRLEPFQLKFQRKHWEQAIGSSGSLRAIDKVLIAKNWSKNGITREGLEQLVQHIMTCSNVYGLNLPDLDQERVPVFVGGVAIVYATFKSLGISQMTVSDGALREGLIQDLLGRIYDHDIRSETVRSLATRYHVDIAHAQRIQRTLDYLFAQLPQGYLIAEEIEAKQFLHWAAQLHELGHDIAHSQYHKHSAYVIEHADLAGFSRQDQVILATIVRAHRRKFSMKLFTPLHAPWHLDAPKLALLLRLAVLLNRSRQDYALPDIKCGWEFGKIKLHFPLGWLDQAPLTRADLLHEATNLKTARIKLEIQ